jgi:reverse gyrase
MDITYRCACSWVGGDPDERRMKNGKVKRTCPACLHHDRKRVEVHIDPQQRAALIERILTKRATNYELDALIDIAQHVEAEALARLTDAELIAAGEGDDLDADEEA